MYGSSGMLAGGSVGGCDIMLFLLFMVGLGFGGLLFILWLLLFYVQLSLCVEVGLYCDCLLSSHRYYYNFYSCPD